MDGVSAREERKNYKNKGGVKGDRTASASQTPIASASQKHWGNCDRNRCSKTTSKKLTFVLEVLSKYSPKKV